MKGDDASVDKLDEDLQIRTMKRDGVMTEDVEQLRKENEELAFKLEEFRAQPSDIEIAKEERANLNALPTVSLAVLEMDARRTIVFSGILLGVH